VEFQKAIALNPNYAIAHHWYGQFLRLMGREEDSILEGKKALDLDPRSLIINVEAGLPYHYSQRYDEALSHFRKAVELDPNFALAHHDIGWVLEAEGRYPEAIQEFERAVQISDVAALWSSLGTRTGWLAAMRTPEQSWCGSAKSRNSTMCRRATRLPCIWGLVNTIKPWIYMKEPTRSAVGLWCGSKSANTRNLFVGRRASKLYWER
jgi:tetratricopeptide (TPR) repeat protein